jgi:hypothetical protein
MNCYPLAHRAGIAKRTIQKVLGSGVTEKDLFSFIHGDVNLIYKTLPKPSGNQSWETTGKRFVHLEEARFVAKHFLRNAIRPKNQKALILSGTDPALACLPWIMSGIATRFVAYESNYEIYQQLKENLIREKLSVINRLPKRKRFELELVFGNILDEEDRKYGIIDLDFCNNRIRTWNSRAEILELVDEVSPLKGPFVLRTTLHVGRTNNSREDIERHIELFEKELRYPEDTFHQKYRIRASDRSPYQSVLPMISLVWILERKYDDMEDIGAIE